MLLGERTGKKARNGMTYSKPKIKKFGDEEGK